VEAGIYETKADQERATILLANDLSKISGSVSEQLSEVERLIRIEENELSRLDSILAKAKDQINALNGINSSVLSVKEAIDNLALAIQAQVGIMGGVTPSPISNGNSAGWDGVVKVDGKPVTSADKVEQAYTISEDNIRRSESLFGQTGIKGYAMVNGRWVPQYATGASFDNGIVSRPTMFDASLMGEAGPEAIMPLTSIGGSLGVRAVMPDMQEVVEELQALRGETTMLRAEVRAVATNTNKSAKLLDRAMPDGQRVLVTVD
jgi:prefoldin subunit 5